jgi:protein TonB
MRRKFVLWTTAVAIQWLSGSAIAQQPAGVPGVAGMGQMMGGKTPDSKIVLSKSGDLVRVPGAVADGNILTKVQPVYPPIARAAHVEGSVVMHALIGKDGAVKQLDALIGPDMLKGAAVDAVRQWTYKPYMLDGVPIAVDTTITVKFILPK